MSGNGNGERPFVVDWREAVFRSQLSNATKVVAFGLAIYMTPDGRNARPSIETLADAVRVAPSTVAASRAELIATGYLTVVRAGGGRASMEVRAVLPESAESSSPPMSGRQPTGERSTTDHRPSDGSPPTTGRQPTDSAPLPTDQRQGTREQDTDEQERATYRPSDGSCSTCDGTGWVLDDDDVARACAECGLIRAPLPVPVDYLDGAAPTRTAPPPKLLERDGRTHHDMLDPDGDVEPF